MCTVTLIRAGSDIRVACNRDERIARPDARPPAPVTIGGRRAVMPIDPEGGGTWIAATEAGLVFTVLNVNDVKERRTGSRRTRTASRGLVIPRLVRCSTPDAAISEMRGSDWSAFAPFRLLVISRTRHGEARWNGRHLTTRRGPLRTPFMRTTSGLGDARVEGPRGRLFRRMVLRRPDRRAAQDRFHAHVWPSRPHLSVLMSRAGAHTVSQTVVELSAGRAVMRYVARPR
ncbi:MAG: NRDE family protein [Vicinamibacterales bacterium]